MTPEATRPELTSPVDFYQPDRPIRLAASWGGPTMKGPPMNLWATYFQPILDRFLAFLLLWIDSWGAML